MEIPQTMDLFGEIVDATSSLETQENIDEDLDEIKLVDEAQQDLFEKDISEGGELEFAIA